MFTIIEWRQAREHLVEQYAKCPPIDTHIIPDMFEHLRREVLRRPTKRVCLVRGGHVNLAQAEIAQCQVTRHVESVRPSNEFQTQKKEEVKWVDAQNILRLQIPIHDIQLV